MNRKTYELRPGDLVEVRSPEEIAKTLDAAGTLEQLPFMREMVEYCGKRFRVSRRVVKLCASGMKTGSTLRGFDTDDVVLLEGLRCSGADHGGCQKCCTIFWREAWLQRVEEEDVPTVVQAADREQFRAGLRTTVGTNAYFCQASELLKATRGLARWERYLKCFSDLRAGNCGILEMARRISIFLFWKARRVVFGPYARGKSGTTPTEKLDLRAGEWVQVKPMNRIVQTLDATASNRGLWFSPNMRLLCGQQQRVERRIDKLIVDGSGEMRELHDTVFLEGSFCGCAHIAFGGCSRAEYVYWREVWLSRSDKSRPKRY